MLQAESAGRHVRSNKLFSLFSPETQAGSKRFAGRIIGLLLRLFISRMNKSMYVAMRAPPRSTRLMRLMRVPPSSLRTRARTKLQKSDAAGSSRSWMQEDRGECGGADNAG
jgi:hypothetical protein